MLHCPLPPLPWDHLPQLTVPLLMPETGFLLPRSQQCLKSGEAVLTSLLWLAAATVAVAVAVTTALVAGFVVVALMIAVGQPAAGWI